MASPNTLAIKQFSLDNVTWTPITATVDCNYWSLKAVASVFVRSDSGDASTQDTLSANSSEIVGETAPLSSAHATRYRAGDTLLFAQAGSGTTTVYLRCMK